MPMWLYVLGCVVVPAVWGVMMYLAFNAVDRRRKSDPSLPASEDRPPPIDYSI